MRGGGVGITVGTGVGDCECSIATSHLGHNAVAGVGAGVGLGVGAGEGGGVGHGVGDGVGARVWPHRKAMGSGGGGDAVAPRWRWWPLLPRGKVRSNHSHAD